jgi:hypothetical protein
VVNGEEPTQNGEDSEAARKKNNKRKRRNADDKLEEISKFMLYTITGRRNQAQHGVLSSLAGGGVTRQVRLEPVFRIRLLPVYTLDLVPSLY